MSNTRPVWTATFPSKWVADPGLALLGACDQGSAQSQTGDELVEPFSLKFMLKRCPVAGLKKGAKFHLEV